MHAIIAALCLVCCLPLFSITSQSDTKEICVLLTLCNVFILGDHKGVLFPQAGTVLSRFQGFFASFKRVCESSPKSGIVGKMSSIAELEQLLVFAGRRLIKNGLLKYVFIIIAIIIII